MNEEEKKRPESGEDTPNETTDEEVMEAPFDEERLQEEQPPADAETDLEEVEDDGATTSEQEIESLRAELESATRERDEYLDSMRRLKAEFENSRKRQEREKERVLQAASERVIVALLPVLDNFDRALEAEGDIRDGVQATRDQLSAALEQEGLLLVESDGESFDPNLHEAVMSQPSEEHEEGTVIQTFERGYILNGRSIRPARVVVSHQV